MAAKRNPLKGLADFERKVSSSPKRVNVSLKKAEKKSEPEKSAVKSKEKKTRAKRTNHKSGEINMAEFKRQFMKERANLYK